MLIQHEFLTPLVPKLVGLIFLLVGLRSAICGFANEQYVEITNARINAGLPQPRYALWAKYAVGVIGLIGLVFYSPTNGLLICVTLILFVVAGAIGWLTRKHIPKVKIQHGLFAGRLGFLFIAFFWCAIGLALMAAPLGAFTGLEKPNEQAHPPV